MHRRIIYLLISVLFFLGSLYLLLNAHPMLESAIPIYPDIPVGTLTTWAGIIALPCIIFFSIKGFHPPGSLFSSTYKLGLTVIIILSASWGMVSFLLAGNWSFNFSNTTDGFQGSTQASVVFIRYTYFLVFLPFVYLLIFGFHSLVRKFTKT